MSARRLGSIGVAAALLGATLLVGSGIVKALPARAAATVPVIYAITPNSGPSLGGTGVTIYGAGFTGAVEVRFGSTNSSCSQSGGFFVVSDTQIVGGSPPGAVGTVDVVVVGPGGSSAVSAADKFTYLSPFTPVVNGLSPNSGTTLGGRFVTINGSGFTNATQVMFGPNPVGAGPISDTVIQVSSPPGAAGTVDVRVVNSVGTSAITNADKFTYVAPGGPVVEAVSPNSGGAVGGTPVAIVGTGFAGATLVHFGSAAVSVGTFASVDDTHIFVNAPAGTAATTVDVTVTTPSGTSAVINADKFSYLAPAAPVVNAVFIQQGPTAGGTQDELVGSGFTGVTAVKFGGATAAGVTGNDSFLIMTSPPGSAGTVDITVTTPVGTSALSSADHFTFVANPFPVVYGIYPNRGTTLGGTSVQIIGAGLAGTTAVHFGANPGTTIFASDSNLTVTSPAGGAGTVDITVITPAGTSATSGTDHYTYVTPGVPAVDSVSPNVGVAGGGEGINIFGSGFTGATGVKFGANGATFTPSTDNEIIATSPPGTAGTTVDITVTTPTGMSAATNADHYSYVTPVAPTVSTISPSTGPGSGGTAVWITGTMLSSVNTVKFGAAPVGFQLVSENVIKVFGSPSGSGIVDVTVTSPGGTSAVTPGDKFSYGASPLPAITAVSPATGTASGGTKVYVSGSGFSGASAVDFGANPAGFFVFDDGLIIATSRAGTASTTVDVRVVGPGGTSSVTTNDQFTYTAAVVVPPPVISTVSPNTGPPGGGTFVYIMGSNFLGTNQVWFGPNIDGGWSVASDSLIIAPAASGTPSTTVDIKVVTPAGTTVASANDKFTYGAANPPVVTSISPATGPSAGGTTVYIHGSNMNGVTGVSFGGTSATGIFVQGNELVQATSPAQGVNPATVDVTVTSSVGTSATSANDKFVYGGPPPSGLQVNGVSPASGPIAGGIQVRITGLGFTGVTAVSFGATPAQSFFLSTDSLIFAISPAGSLGAVDVTVAVGASVSAASNADKFTYTALVQPVVNAVDPNHGASSGGTGVTVYGHGFAGATAVHFGANSISPVFPNNDTAIFVNSPPGTAATSVDVTVTNSAGTSATSGADTFSYLTPGPPVVNAVDPSGGSALGGDNIILFGSNFSGASTVTFGSAPASFNIAADNQIYAAAPAGTAGTSVDVTVTTGIGTSTTSNADKFAYRTPASPVVRAVSSNRGGIAGGRHVRVFGTGLSGTFSAFFGATAALNVYSVAADEIDMTSPPGALGTVDVTVTTSVGTSAISAADQYTYFAAPPPSITAVSPNSGLPGSFIFLTGTGFSGAISVLFGTACAAIFFFSPNDTSLQLGVPPGPVGTLDVTVVSPDGTSATSTADHFTYTAAPVPTVTAVAPASGQAAGGTTVFVSGSGLASVTGVSFGTTPAASCCRGGRRPPSFFAFDDGLLEVTSPAGTNGTTVDVRVTTPGGTSTTIGADQFTWGPTPATSVTGVGPSSGPGGGGADVFVSGSGFLTTTQLNFGTTTVGDCSFLAVAQSAGVRSPMSFTPKQLRSVRLPVVTRVPIHDRAGGGSSKSHFATVLVPSVPHQLPSSVAPPSAASRAASTRPSGSQATFSGCSSGFIVFNDNLIDVVSPGQGANPATVDITVTTAGGTSATGASDRYTFTTTPAPVVSAVSPGSGRSGGGNTVFISGSNLEALTAVHFGTAVATIQADQFFQVSSDSFVQVASPPGTNGSTVDVTVTTAGGTSATSAADHFSYGATPVPSVGALSPGSGPSGSSTFVTGTGLLGTTVVDFGTTPALRVRGPSRTRAAAASPSSGFAVVSDNLIQVFSPTHAVGTVDVTVTTAGGTSATSVADHYTYTASPTPVVTALGPNSGSAAGGTLVYVNGSGLTGASLVVFGATAATTFSIISDSLIQATSPAGSGTVDVRVTTPGGTSATGAPDQFTYTAGLPPTVTSVVPNRGPTAGGTSVTITGTNFTGVSGVKFGTLPAASFTVNNTTQITAKSPPGSGLVDVTVTTASGTSATSSADQYYYPGLLRVTTSPAVPAQITVDGSIADTWGLNWLEVQPGSRAVCFSAVTGYTAPACQTVSVSSGVTTTVTGAFVQRGFLRVITSPAVPSAISIDGTPMDDWGAYTDVPIGSHQVCFGLVPHFTPPACQTAVITAGATTTITGTFTSMPSAGGQTNVGLLRVTTSPALPSQITVDGNIADTWGLNWLEIAPGSHTVCFSYVPGYTSPACQTVTVNMGVTTSVTGTFVQRGFLQVHTSPPSPGTIFINALPADDWGLYTDLPAGTYQVCFGAVVGLVNTPACQSAVVTAGSTTTITGTYT